MNKCFYIDDNMMPPMRILRIQKEEKVETVRILVEGTLGGDWYDLHFSLSEPQKLPSNATSIIVDGEVFDIVKQYNAQNGTWENRQASNNLDISALPRIKNTTGLDTIRVIVSSDGRTFMRRDLANSTDYAWILDNVVMTINVHRRQKEKTVN